MYFNVYGSVHRNNIPVYIQQDAMSHSLFYPKSALHISGDTSPQHQECKQLYLQHLVFVTPLLLPAAIAAGSSCNDSLLRHVCPSVCPHGTTRLSLVELS